jgi:hypothetical protein
VQTREFASFIQAVKGKEYQGFHPAKLVFQAIRIHLNDEFNELRRGLAAGAQFTIVLGFLVGRFSWLNLDQISPLAFDGFSTTTPESQTMVAIIVPFVRPDPGIPVAK